MRRIYRTRQQESGQIGRGCRWGLALEALGRYEDALAAFGTLADSYDPAGMDDAEKAGGGVGWDCAKGNRGARWRPRLGSSAGIC